MFLWSVVVRYVVRCMCGALVRVLMVVAHAAWLACIDEIPF